MNFHHLVYQYIDIEINKELKKLRAARRWLRCREQLLDTNLTETDRRNLLEKKKRLGAKHCASWMRQLVGLDRRRHERDSISDREHLRRAEYHIVGRILAVSKLRSRFANLSDDPVKANIGGVTHLKKWQVDFRKADLKNEAKRFKSLATRISRQHAKSLALLEKRGSTEA